MIIMELSLKIKNTIRIAIRPLIQSNKHNITVYFIYLL
jgi:hypothetical protein